MKCANFFVLTTIALSLAACVGSVPLEGKSCPCTTGFVCCEATNQCLAPGEFCGKNDAGSPTTVNADASADAPNLGVQNAIGRRCDPTVTAGAAQGVYNASASECPSNLCLKPVVEVGASMPMPPTQATCTAECAQDSDCNGELRDVTNPADQRCLKGFACGIPFVEGPLCCKKLCMCKDFLGTAGAATPIACTESAADSCGGEPISSVSGVGQQTDIYITVAPNRLLDLVFMVDNSPSMAPKQQKMNAQFPKLIAALKDPNDGSLPDLRVAIIDSDLGTGGMYTSGSCGPKNGSNYGDLGKFQMIGATACGVTSPDATYLEYIKGQPLNYTGDINTVFACLAGNLGTLGCGEEHQLQAFEFALVAGGLGNEAQHAMLRPTAYLGLVFLTDEDDCSAAMNDGMFGDKPELRGESASLRCYTRSHDCEGRHLTVAPPGYPTSAPYSTTVSNCAARTDACPNLTDGSPSGTDTSVPTDCSPLKDYVQLAYEVKSLKSDPDQILVAGIFGWPIDGDLTKAPYKIDLIPNANTADTAHPMVYDSWPTCYDPNHMPAAATMDKTTGFDSTAAGWGATAGLRLSAFVDEFGANGLKFSICQTDFSASMKNIGDTIAKKLQNLCVDYKLIDTDQNPADGIQADCRVVYRHPVVDAKDPSIVIYLEDPNSMPQCDPSKDDNTQPTYPCWKLVSDKTKCPINGQLINVVRAPADRNTPLDPGTKVSMQCRTCPDSILGSAAIAGCNYTLN